MQKSIILAIVLLPAQFIFGQNLEKLISVTEVKRVESTLSADEMQGRATFSPGIEKAADFISQEFKKAGISPLAGSNSFRQTFSMVKCTNQQASGAIDGQSVDQANMVAFSSSTNLRFNQDSGFEKISIRTGHNAQ